MKTLDIDPHPKISFWDIPRKFIGIPQHYRLFVNWASWPDVGNQIPIYGIKFMRRFMPDGEIQIRPKSKRDKVALENLTNRDWSKMIEHGKQDIWIGTYG